MVMIAVLWVRVGVVDGHVGEHGDGHGRDINMGGLADQDAIAGGEG